jgi:hypothetical protein
LHLPILPHPWPKPDLVHARHRSKYRSIIQLLNSKGLTCGNCESPFLVRLIDVPSREIELEAPAHISYMESVTMWQINSKQMLKRNSYDLFGMVFIRHTASSGVHMRCGMAFIQVHAHVVKLGPALYIRWIILLCLISTEVVEVRTNDRSEEFCGNRRVVTHGNE